MTPGPGADPDRRPRRPNLVLLIADEMRADTVGHLGNPCDTTPGLDALMADDAVSFSACFTQNTVCVPSRVAMMTGWYPHVRGHRTMFHLLHADEPNLLRRLRGHGYQVWWSGKNDLLAHDVIHDSYDVRHTPEANPDAPPVGRAIWPQVWPEVGEPGYWSHYAGRLPEAYDDDADRRRAEGALRFLDDRDDDRPFCLLLTFSTPHVPYAVSEPWYSRFDRDAVPAPIPPDAPGDGKPATLAGIRDRAGLNGWDDAQWRELKATYYGMVARTDDIVTGVVDGLRERGLYDDTAVVFTADHGDFAGDYGLPEKAQNVMDDCLTRVPFVLKPPAGVAIRPGVCDAPVELVDLTATVEELAGMTADYTHFSRSLLPLLADRDHPHRDGVLCEGGRLPGETQAMELGSDQSPAHHYYPKLMAQHDDVNHGKAVMWRTRTHKYVHRIAESDELYDLRADPQERRNVIDDPAQAAVLAELRTRLLDVMITTADVVPTRLDDRQGRSPDEVSAP